MTLIEKLTQLSEQLATGEITEHEYELATNRMLNGATTIEIFGASKPLDDSCKSD
jgi:hypothetical protein